MGLLNEFFLAVDDEEAGRALPDGPAAAAFAEIVFGSGMTNREVELIEPAVFGTATQTAVTVLAHEDNPEGPWVVGFPEVVTDALLEVGPRDVDAIAATWASFPQMVGADKADLAGLLTDLVDLVAIGASSGRAPYLWICT